MAIARVQVKGATFSSVTTAALAYDSSPSAGNSQIVMLAMQTSGITATIADNQSNSYTEDEYFDPGGENSRPAYIWSSSNVAGGATTVTITPSALVSLALVLLEVDQQIEVDDNAHLFLSSSPFTTHPCGEITTTVADTYVVTCSANSSDALTETPETGYTELFESARAFFQERIPTSTETLTGTWESTGLIGTTSGHVAYKESAAAPGQDLTWQGGGMYLPPTEEIVVVAY
jgi:hypothetical protein